jgi:hypothetical protein
LQETPRPLPPGWHMTGPQGVNYSGGHYRLPLPEADEAGAGGDGAGALPAFMRQALGAQWRSGPGAWG